MGFIHSDPYCEEGMPFLEGVLSGNEPPELAAVVIAGASILLSTLIVYTSKTHTTTCVASASTQTWVL